MRFNYPGIDVAICTAIWIFMGAGCIWVGFTIVPAVSCLLSAVVFGFYRLDRAKSAA